MRPIQHDFKINDMKFLMLVIERKKIKIEDLITYFVNCNFAKNYYFIKE